MPRRDLLKNVKRIVIKVGTSTIAGKKGIDFARVRDLVSQIDLLRKTGYEVILVTSGAIGAGCTLLGKSRDDLSLPEKQALAAVGQPYLMEVYRELFGKKKIQVGQILLTEDDIDHRRRFLNARHALNALLSLDIVPIINENDSVVIKEIKFGDNDTLSAHVLGLIDAQLLIILSDIDGFYRDLADPRPLELVESINDEIRSLAGGAGSSMGTGGMLTKINAAEIVLRFGEVMIIARGSEKNILARLMAGEKAGTFFAGPQKPLPSRKKWLALHRSRGILEIDEGAVRALVKGKKSLLPTGILHVSGKFEMGDAVDITDSEGTIIAKGLVNYNAGDLARITGKKSADIRLITQGGFFEEAVNRNNLLVY